MEKQHSSPQRSLPRIWHYRLYRRTLLSVFVLLIVLFATIGILLYSEFSVYADNQTAAFATDLMTQQVNSTQNLWDDMNALSSTMQTDQSVSSYLLGNERDPLVRYHAFRSLGKYKALHPFIQNISLYNFSTADRLNLKYYSSEQEIVTQEQIAFGMTLSVPRQVSFPGVQESQVLTIVFPVRNYTGGYTSCIAIDIQIERLQAMLQSANAGAHIYIVDDEDQLLVRPDDGYMPGEWDAVLAVVRRKQTDRGSFYRKIAQQKTLISYCRFPTQAWTVVALQPAQGLLAAARSRIILLVSILLGLLVVSMVVIFVMVLRIFRPIDNLMAQLPHDSGAVVDEMAVISKELNAYRSRSNSMMQSLYQANVQALLLGLPCDRAELPPAITGAHRFVVGVLSPTQKHEYAPDELNQLAKRQLQGLSACVSFRWTDHRVLVFCFDHVQPDALSSGFGRFCQACRDKHGSAVRLGISAVVDSPELLHLAYTEALRLSSDAFYHQERMLFTPDSSASWRTAPATPTNTWVNRMSGLLFHEQPNDVHQTLEEMLAECAQLPPNFCIHVVCDVLRQCAELVGSTCQGKGTEELAALLEQLEQAASYAQLHRLSLLIVDKCHQLLNESEQQRSLLHGQRIVRQVCQLIEKRYQSPAFSLQDAADEVSLSAGYLGRLFKQTTGQSFAEYLTACRLREAERLLTQTDTPIALISSQIGMENASYFSTVFRKAYGISPSLFREAAARQKNNAGPETDGAEGT